MTLATEHRTTPAADPGEAYRQLLSESPSIRIRDAAEQIGVSEAELVAANVDARSTPLRPEWYAIIEVMPELGPVMTLTRNESAVHEKVGTFEDVSTNGHGGLVLGPDIDLRIFFARWHHGFLVEKEIDGKTRRSLQFFDCDGTAVHKIFARDDTDMAAFDKLVARFVDSDRVEPINIRARKEGAPDRPDNEIDVARMREVWENLKDTHDFFPMLRKFKVGRVQAMRLIGEDFAYRVPTTAFRQIVEGASESGLEIMIFVGSPGCIQIHTGPVKKLKTMGPWFNVLDPGFNLHLREDHIASTWIVKKPTEDGIVTSLEIFDADNNVIALTFGKRKPDEAELESWRVAVAAIEAETGNGR